MFMEIAHISSRSAFSIGSPTSSLRWCSFTRFVPLAAPLGEARLDRSLE